MYLTEAYLEFLWLQKINTLAQRGQIERRDSVYRVSRKIKLGIFNRSIFRIQSNI